MTRDNRQTNWPNFITAVSITTIIAAEVFVVAHALAWSLGGLYNLGRAAGLILHIVLGAVGLYLILVVWKRIQVIEPIWMEPARGPEE
jgi:hypothetical protein